MIIKTQEDVRKILETLNNKVNMEDAESINNLLNDLWERFHELEKATGTGNAADKPPPRLTLSGGGGAG